MIPTPPPVLINMPDTGAPWWGVPLLAGLFVVGGALVALLSTRASDVRKANREEKQRILTEARTYAVSLLEATRRVERLVAMQETFTKSKPASEFLSDIVDLIDDVEEAWTRFELSASEDMLQPGLNLLGATIALAIPDLSSESTARFRGDYHRSRLVFVNALRLKNGVEPITREIEDPKTQEEHLQHLQEYLRAAADVMLKKHPNPKSTAPDERIDFF